jgi:hypothetical protein
MSESQIALAHLYRMPYAGVAQYFDLLFLGLLAGFEVAVHYGIGAPPPVLPESYQIVFRQAMVRRLRVLAPIIFLPSLLLTVLIAIQERHSAGRLRYTAIAMLLVWIAIRIVRTVPVNSATLEWNPNAPPMDWRSMVERAERYHVVAAWAAIIAFLSSLASALGFY